MRMQLHDEPQTQTALKQYISRKIHKKINTRKQIKNKTPQLAPKSSLS